MLAIGFVSLFPELIEGFVSHGLLGKACAEGRCSVHVRSPRAYSTSRFGHVDDAPYGGGPGMVLRPEPVLGALEALTSEVAELASARVIILSASGQRFDQVRAAALATEAQQQGLIFVCGRYEGIDARVSHFADESLRIGDYVLQGGEVAALVVTEAVTRLVPGVLGNQASLQAESFDATGLGEYPQYTRPPVFRGLEVPPVLRSGDHARIAAWRAAMRAGLDQDEVTKVPSESG